jgi:hypothetical protein
MPKGSPIPVKFDYEEERLIKSINRSTGLSVSEIVRRAVRLLRYEMSNRSDAEALRFLITELAPPSSVKHRSPRKKKQLRNAMTKTSLNHRHNPRKPSK